MSIIAMPTALHQATRVIMALFEGFSIRLLPVGFAVINTVLIVVVF